LSWTRVFDGPEASRVNKWMAQTGVCSRREAESLILQGLVSIDGIVISEPGHKIEPGQTLTLADTATEDLAAKISVVVHKPMGLVSAHPEDHQDEARSLITPDRFWSPLTGRQTDGQTGGQGSTPAYDLSLPPLGRLDLDSRGLLLLSEDGVLAKAVIGPDSNLEKEYLVRVAGEIKPGKISLLQHGLSLDGRKLLPARVSQIGAQDLRIVLNEGRNRQIRRMCEAVGLYVQDLLRVRIGPLRLQKLPQGMWRYLTAQERQDLIAGQHDKA
jgi:23S rRNA pseudouridine2604 synthase